MDATEDLGHDKDRRCRAAHSRIPLALPGDDWIAVNIPIAGFSVDECASCFDRFARDVLICRRTYYLANMPYSASCRMMDIAWGGLMSFICLYGLLAAWRTGRMDAAFASLLALALVSPVLWIALASETIGQMARFESSTLAIPKAKLVTSTAAAGGGRRRGV